MTDIEKKLNNHAECGFKLFKLYAKDEERDDDIPDILDYLDELYDYLKDKCMRLALRVTSKNADFREVNDYTAYKRSLDTANRWLNTIPDEMHDYYMVRKYSAAYDLEIRPVVRYTLPIIIAMTKNGQIQLVPADKTIAVYDITLTDDWMHAYIPLESARVNGFDTVVTPDTLVVGHPYADVRAHVLAKSYACKDCGKIFTIPPKERDFFRYKGLDLPKCCRACRALRS